MEVRRHHSWTRHQMEMVSFTPRSLYPWRKSPLDQLYWRTGVAQRRCGYCEIKKLLPLRESNPGCPIRSQSQYELIYFHKNVKIFQLRSVRPEAADGGDGLQVWRVVTNILYYQFRTVQSWGVMSKLPLVQNIMRCLGFKLLPFNDLSNGKFLWDLERLSR
jgi:hypothetical protein